MFTPDDIMGGASVRGPVVVYDSESAYLGSLVVERLCQQGHEVTLVSPTGQIAGWTMFTMEQPRITARMYEICGDVFTDHRIASISPGAVTLEHAWSGKPVNLPVGAVVLVTARLPNDRLYLDLADNPEALAEAGIKSVDRIGDCVAPHLIAAAVHGGHRYAREMDEEVPETPFARKDTIWSSYAVDR